MNLRTKLILLFLLVGIVPIAVLGYLSIDQSQKAIQHQSEDGLVKVRDINSYQIENYIQTIKDQIATKSQSSMIQQKMRQFDQAFEDLDRVLGTYYQNNQRQIQEGIRNRLRTQKDITYDAPSNAVQQWYPGSPEAEILQHFYIAENQYPVGSKQKLDNAGDGSRWSALHEEFHPVMRNFLNKFGYYDIFLVEPDEGQVVYSVFKEIDLGTSMLKGPFANTGFAEVVQKAKRRKSTSFVAFDDFQQYPPSKNSHQSFMATPIMENDDLLGILVFQMPMDKIREIMTFNQEWEKHGMSQTGESYLVASDGTLRSDLRPLLEDQSSFVSKLEERGRSEDVTAPIKQLNTTVGYLSPDYEFISDLFNGQSDVIYHQDYLGRDVLSAYEPLDVEGVEWGIIASQTTDEIFSASRWLTWMLFISGVLIALIVVALAYYFSTSISNALSLVSDRIFRMAEGDLDQEQIEMDREDEIGELADAYNGMTENLNLLVQQASAISQLNLNAEILQRDIAGDLGEAFQAMVTTLEDVVLSIRESVNKVASVSEEVRSASTQLNQSSQELSEGAEEQSSSIEETSSSVEEMASMIDQSSDNAEESDQLAQEASETAEDGKQVIDEMAATMEQINEESEQIQQAVEVIDDIAFQTNLLALNAAVEAANAGEHGSGFAVVADEVRELAQRSSEAAEEISEIIQESVERTEEGAKHAGDSQDVLSDINERITKVAERMNEISEAANEQSKGIEEINQAITELEQVTEQNTSNAEQTASSSDELTSQANSMEEVVKNLRDIVSQFDLRDQITQNVTFDSEDDNASGARQSEPTHESEEAAREDVLPLETDKGGFD